MTEEQKDRFNEIMWLAEKAKEEKDIEKLTDSFIMLMTEVSSVIDDIQELQDEWYKANFYCE